MAKASSKQPAVKTLTINKSKDIVIDRLIQQCEEEKHSRCTGWAVRKNEFSPVDANVFLRCTCACHQKKEQPRQVREKKKQQQPKKKTATKKRSKISKKSKRNKTKKR